MIDTSDTVTINRPIEEVFAYVTDTSNDPAWHTDALEARKMSEGPIGKGTKWHVRFKPAMGVSEGEMEVVAFEPNRTEVQRGVIGPMQPTLTYVFEPADGGTGSTPCPDQGIRNNAADGATHEAHDPERQRRLSRQP